MFTNQLYSSEIIHKGMGSPVFRESYGTIQSNPHKYTYVYVIFLCNFGFSISNISFMLCMYACEK